MTRFVDAPKCGHHGLREHVASEYEAGVVGAAAEEIHLDLLEVEIPEYGLQSRVHGSSRARSGEFYLIADVERRILAVAALPRGPFDSKRSVLFVVARNRT